MSVRILNAALDEYEGQLVLRGVLDPGTLGNLLTDDYQREVSPVSSLARIMRGYEQGSAVPDIELGMRGHRKTCREGIYTLQDPVYIIDGQQRVEAAKMYGQNGNIPHLGATIHFGTSKEWERRQFKILNADRVRVSSNVILRNFREDYPAVKMLFDIAESDKEFAMKGRVCWEQRQKRDHLISAMMLAKLASLLHAHETGIESPSGRAEDLCLRLQKVLEVVGKNIYRSNVKMFFEILDGCWGLKRVVYTEKATFIKATFLLTLSRLLSNHEVFWRDHRLFVDVDLRRKLASFPIGDPTVIQLACTGSKVDVLLYKLIVDHLNKGKRTRQLKERCVIDEEKLEEAPLSSDNSETTEVEANAQA